MSFKNADRICLFCYNRMNNIFHSKEDILTPEQIISSCNQHLTKTIIDEVDWTNSVAESFCRECYNLTEKLFELNSHLDKLRNNINSLGTSLANRIYKERKKYKLTSHNSVPISNQSTSENRIKENDLKTLDCFGNKQNSTEADFENETHQDTDDEETSAIDDYNDNDEDEISCTAAVVRENVDSATCIEISQKQTSKMESPILKHVLTTVLEKCAKNNEDSDFTCKQCHENFSRQILLQRHKCSKPVDSVKVRTYVTNRKNQIKAAECSVKLKSGEILYKCEYCGRTFNKKCSYVPHVRKHERSEHSLTCEFCGKKLSSMRCLRRHLIIHQQDRPFNCSTCNRGFCTKYEYSVHLKSHLHNKPSEPTNKYKCDACNKGFTSKINFNRHLKKHLLKPTKEKSGAEILLAEKLKQRRLYKCGKCDKSFWDTSSLTRHCLSRHSDKKFNCLRYHKSFQIENTLLRHYERKHKPKIKRERKNFPCLICQRNLTSAKFLQIHQAKQHTVTIKPVQQRPSAIPTPGLGNSGNPRLTNPPDMEFSCLKCKIDFQNKMEWTNHEMKQRAEKNIILMCNYCKKIFEYKCEYQIHHSKEHRLSKPVLKCTLCEATMADYDYIRTHVIVRHPTEIGLKPNKPISNHRNRRLVRYQAVTLEVITIDSDCD